MRPIKQFVNVCTREAYLDVLLDWCQRGDPADVAREWLDMGQATAAESLAEQLRKDLAEMYSGENCPEDYLMAAVCRAGFRKIYWPQVAEALLLLAIPDAEAEAGEPPGGDAAGGVA